MVYAMSDDFKGGSSTDLALVEDERVESEAEGNDEDEEDCGEGEEGLEDVDEHDDVDAEEGQLADVDQEVEPGQDDGH